MAVNGLRLPARSLVSGALLKGPPLVEGTQGKVDGPSWLHLLLLGRGGARLRLLLTQEVGSQPVGPGDQFLEPKAGCRSRERLQAPGRHRSPGRGPPWGRQCASGRPGRPHQKRGKNLPQAGLLGFCFGRLDDRDKKVREEMLETEPGWRASASLKPPAADLFPMSRGRTAPGSRRHYPTTHTVMTMHPDFQRDNANMWSKNPDKCIQLVSMQLKISCFSFKT